MSKKRILSNADLDKFDPKLAEEFLRAQSANPSRHHFTLPQTDEELLKKVMSPDGMERPAINEYSKKRLGEILAELARRQIEALNLFEPLPHQLPALSSMAKERLIRGSNRSGKTMIAAVEIARAALGKDPFNKYPKTDGRCYIVGKGWEEIGSVLWPKLGRAGAFRMIRDLGTGLWRAYRPWLPEDEARFVETKPAPPLIPPRFIKSIAWNNKKKNEPRKVQLKTGWELSFYSSEGSPPTGVDLDLVWFDEEIEVEEWYTEMAARLLDRRGRFVWSATPQNASEQLFDLHKRCERLADTPDAKAKEIFIKLRDNPHIPQEEKTDLASKYTDQEKRIRIEGEFAYVERLVYGEFSKEVHTIGNFDPDPTWPHYMILDPGRTVCATAFIAVPPLNHPQFGGRKIMYDELYIKQCTAFIWGEQVAHKIRGRRFVGFIIDRHAGRQNEMGSGKNIEMQYCDELRNRELMCEQGGYGFAWGSDDVKARILKVKNWLEPRQFKIGEIEVFSPTILFCERCKNCFDEFERYHNKVRKDGRGTRILDEPEPKYNHLMNDIEYAAMHGIPWVEEPHNVKRPPSGVYKAYLEKVKRKAQSEGRAYIRLGPGD